VPVTNVRLLWPPLHVENHAPKVTQCQRELRPFTPLVNSQLKQWLIAGLVVPRGLPDSRKQHMEIDPKSFEFRDEATLDSELDAALKVFEQS